MGKKIVAKTDVPPPPEGNTAAVLSLIERMVRDPNISVERVMQFLAMRNEMENRQAKRSFLAALAEMQPKLPVIDKRGKIERGRHKDTGEQQKASPYAKYEDVIEAIRPVLAEHGFALSFRINQTPDRMQVTGILSHRDGHSEETSISLPFDMSGGKNNVQGWGSSVSYGKRYTTFALLNIVARGDDDDGVAAGTPVTITAEQAGTLIEMIESIDGNTDQFCRYFRIGKVAHLPATEYDRALAAVKRKAGQQP